MSTASRFRQIALERRDEFLAKGTKESHFFPHRFYFLPKCGPDGFKLAQRMCGATDPDAAWEIVLYAEGAVLDEFPDALFFDDDVLWHQQHFGRRGQIATANLVVDGRRLYSMVHLSDLIQRIGRQRRFKTRIENRFRGWVHMLLNAAMTFAVEHDLEVLFTPTSDLALLHTDPARSPERELFERVYDRSVGRLFRATHADGWWAIGIEENRDRIVAPESKADEQPEEKTICIVHDVERGFGHRDSDARFAALAEETSRSSLDRMLAAEEAAGVRSTYSVVGAILEEERGKIEAGRHALAFHSFDHGIGNGVATDQLSRCRNVDFRLKGYRAPASVLTPDLREANLLFHNFEWLASSRWSFGFAEPVICKRIVKIPIAFDDFPLYDERMPYEEWERRALDEIERSRFAAFGLHDCYATFWLSHYHRFLERLKAMGTLRTLDEIAAAVVLRNAC